MTEQNQPSSWSYERELCSIARTQNLPYVPICLQRGERDLLWDTEGRRYIDFCSSACLSNLGNSQPEITQAVVEQMNRLGQYIFSYFSTEPAVYLAEKLTSLVPGPGAKKVLFTNSGSAAVDGAIKIARGYTGRSRLLSFVGSYHGGTYGATSLSAINPAMSHAIGPLLPEVYHFPYPYCYRCETGRHSDTCRLDCLNAFQQAFDSWLPPQDVAAIVFEPIAGDAGMVVPPQKYVRALRRLCDEYGILLAADEVQQGLGRTGTWFSLDHFGVVADLYILGKSLGGGLPMGAVLGKAEIMDSLEAPAICFSSAGNPTVSAAALKALEIIERDGLLKVVQQKGDWLFQECFKLQQEFSLIGDVRGMGLSIGLELVDASGGRDRVAAAKICEACIRRGLLLTFFGKNTLRIQPPFIVEQEHLEEGLMILRGALADYRAGKLDNLRGAGGW